MSDEIPDGLDETPIHPQTVEGKIREMRDIGVELIESTDKMGGKIGELRKAEAVMAMAGSVQYSPAQDLLELLMVHVLKLSTLTQLQTDTITQLYGELRGPQSDW